MAQVPGAEPATAAVGAPRPAEARNDWVRDWSAILAPRGGEVLPLVREVYGRLSWATSATTRGLRNRPFNAVPLRRDGGSQEVPTGGWLASEDHKRCSGP